MRMYDVIRKKRDGYELTREEIEFFVKGYTAGEIPDYQASALLMAIYFNSMTDRETADLTHFMAHSGDMADLARFGEFSVDKHSTGGVGDKTSLIVAPIVAALGGKVTKMSGRGLGHTGGTVDKLESIPGYRTSLDMNEFLDIVDSVGMAIIGQSGNFAAADKKLYALRDVTATVDNIPLITASIMSKKLAAGSHSIVLDVKVGSGAFMKTPSEAQTLAEKMVEIGKRCGRRTAALITNMDTPLGNAVGNALEIKEAVEILKGNKKGDLYEVCVALASEMVSLALSLPKNEAQTAVIDAITSGAAFEKMKQWIAAQGGDTKYIEDISLFNETAFSREIKAEKDGFITAMNGEGIGTAALILGAGRTCKEDEIDHSAGIIINKKTGEQVTAGETLCTLYTNREEALDDAHKKYLESVIIEEKRAEEKPLIYKTVR